MVPGLWVGRLEIQPAEAFASGFEVVIMLEEVTRDRVRPPRGGIFLSWPIEDSDERLPDEEVLRVVVDLVERSVRAGRPTLITCMGGLNRSGLVAALALRRLGHSADEALWTASRRARAVRARQRVVRGATSPGDVSRYFTDHADTHFRIARLRRSREAFAP